MPYFSTLYKKLNKEQKQAVDTLDGPVMIIAGPGTGKTMTLTMRIANILQKTDTDPRSVLALTFTESGVKAMRERLVEIIGPTAYYVNINTFHSFCTEVIKEYGEFFQISEDTTPLSELERIQVFKELIDSTDLDALKPANTPYYYLQDIIQNIQNLKREGINPSGYSSLLDNESKQLKTEKKQINPRTGKPYAKYEKMKRDYQKQQELLLIYRSYQRKLKEIQRYDFEDMINFVVATLKKDKNLKLTLQERYLFILVDEYQDTNSAQNQIVKLLTDHWENPNIFVVGDDEQSIYRFQGASLENVLYFKNLFDKTEIITLTSNYRSSQHILDASRSLIKKNLLKLKDVNKNLRSEINHKNIALKTAKFSNASLENDFLAQRIQELIKNKVDPDQIAVLVRNNRDVDDIKDALSRVGIRFEIATGRNILEDGDINRLLILLKVINELKTKPSNDIDIFTLLNFDFLEFDKLDILKLARFSSEKKLNLLDTIIDEDVFNETDLAEADKFIRFVQKLNEWQSLNANATFIKFFETVIQESNFLNWILSDKLNTTRIRTLNTFFNEIKSLNRADHTLNLEKFLENIGLMRENGIKIEEQPLAGDAEAVKLLTAHKSKGLEFEYVFIAKCIDKKWGNNPNREAIKLPEGIVKNTQVDKKEKNEDERRLFYVALTRAKKEIFLTYAENYPGGGYTRQTVPSMFISEIERKLIEKVNIEQFEKAVSQNDIAQLQLPVTKKIEDIYLEEENFLKSVISNMKLSVTALNTYLKCHYKFKINNVLRTPRAKAVHLAFGTAIHKALEIFFKTFKKTHKIPKPDSLLLEYENALRNEILTDQEFQPTLNRGKEVLERYFENNKETFREPLFIEYSFGFKKVYLGDIPLSGKIDRMDWVDRDRKTIKVTDYKTGTPKSRGEIEGKTKYSDRDLIRQLNFYKLLSQLDRNFNYDVVKGEFDFLESKPGKKAKKEEFEYESEDIEDLKTLICKTMDQIRDLKFDRTKEYRHCENCDYKNHCWPDGIPVK
ncbi:MAG: ATP-dependent DNA helicase [Patescibacteria group bacterium]|nr:ATP-dependent helicase [Patescibacteria group bacterium]